MRRRNGCTMHKSARNMNSSSPKTSSRSVLLTSKSSPLVRQYSTDSSRHSKPTSSRLLPRGGSFSTATSDTSSAAEIDPKMVNWFIDHLEKTKPAKAPKPPKAVKTAEQPKQKQTAEQPKQQQQQGKKAKPASTSSNKSTAISSTNSQNNSTLNSINIGESIDKFLKEKIRYYRNQMSPMVNQDINEVLGLKKSPSKHTFDIKMGLSYIQRSKIKIGKESRDPNTICLQIPKAVVKRYLHMSPYLDRDLLQKLLRPQIYLDIQMTNCSGFKTCGRLVFQIFTEACPSIVLSLIRSCASNCYSNFKIKSIFNKLWLEMSFVPDKMLGKDRYREYNAQTLTHDNYSGILSFPVAYIKQQRKLEDPNDGPGHLNLNVSFSSLNIPTSLQRVGFGILQHGRWLLQDIQKLSTKHGTPLHSIEVIKCGALNYI